MNSPSRNKLSVHEMALFAMFAALMFISKAIMQFLPNVHLVGMFVVLLTSLYRVRALIPIYLFVVLDAIFFGIAPWSAPYIYVWAVLWGMVMLIPKSTPKWLQAILFPIVCSLHGFLFGVLCAPLFAVLTKLNFSGMIAWIVAGFSFDIIHGISNLFAGMLVLPLREVILKIQKSLYK